MRRNYFLALLTVIFAFNYVDRLALGIMLQDIKTSLGLTDTQLGLLTGIAFAIFYATMGIPIARWVDRGNRVTVVAVTTGLWSVAVAFCGASRGFVQLLIARMTVAIGEAGCYPAGLSLISDYFPRGERPRAVSRYMLGLPIAITIGYFGGGWLNQLYGWRMTFLLIGCPGIVLAVLAAVKLTEPRHATTAQVPQGRSPQDTQPGFKEVLIILWSNAAFRNLLLCFSVWGFFGYGVQQWMAPFFMRSHHLASGELGTWMALVNGLGGLIGTWLGGELASRYAPNNERLQLLATAWVFVAMVILMTLMFMAPSYQVAFSILAVTAVISMATNGPLFAAIQTLVRPRMRGTATVVLYFFNNLIGLGLGPLVVGALSDALRPHFGEESLRYALVALCPGHLWCAWYLWRASRTLERDMPDAIASEA